MADPEAPADPVSADPAADPANMEVNQVWMVESVMVALIAVILNMAQYMVRVRGAISPQQWLRFMAGLLSILGQLQGERDGPDRPLLPPLFAELMPSLVDEGEAAFIRQATERRAGRSARFCPVHGPAGHDPTPDGHNPCTKEPRPNPGEHHWTQFITTDLIDLFWSRVFVHERDPEPRVERNQRGNPQDNHPYHGGGPHGRGRGGGGPDMAR